MDNQNIALTGERRTSSFLNKVYLKMAAALALTAVVAYFVSTSPAIMRYVVLNPIMMIVLALVQIGLVIYLSARVESMTRGTATLCFAGYAALTGVTFSVIVTAYAGTGIITKAFVSSAAVFGVAAVYGATTKKSIRGWASWLSMALIGIIVVSLINMFIGSSTLDIMVCAAGVLIFSCVTAWDSQKLIGMERMYGADMSEEDMAKISVMGALDLYLDFINIFLYLVRIFARSNDR